MQKSSKDMLTALTAYDTVPYNMRNPIINCTQVRELALFAANQRRRLIMPDKLFTRVSEAFTDAIEADVRALVIRRASEHWQKGVTLT